MTRFVSNATYLRAVELPVVACLVGLGMASATILPLAIAASVFFGGLRIAMVSLSQRRVVILQSPVDLSVVVLIAAACVSLWVSAQPQVTVTQALRLWAGIGLFYALAHYRPRADSKAMPPTGMGWLITLTLLGAALALASPFVVEWSGQSKLGLVPPELYGHFRLMVADGINPNVMAGALVILVPIPLAGLLVGASVSNRMKWVLALAAAVMIAALIVASSRSALFALCIAGISLVLAWRPRFVLVLAAIAIAALLVFIALGILMSPDALREASRSMFSGIVERTEIWSRGLYVVQDFPLTGVGLGNFTLVADTLYPSFTTGTGIEHAHNLALQIAVDLGLPGLIAWLAILAFVITGLIAVTRHTRRRAPIRFALASGLLASQAALIVHGLTDAVTWGMVRSAPIVWMLWGVAMWLWLNTLGEAAQRKDPSC